MPRRLVTAVLTAAALTAIAAPAGADMVTICDRPATRETCERLPLTQWICYHVHDPHLDFCIPPLPPRPAV